MFQIEMLPAQEGDCLLLSYGDPGEERHVLIDGGREKSYGPLKARLASLPEKQRELELLVISHIDRDHIEGVLAMLEDPARPVTFRDIWFNGYDHLQNAQIETFGAVQGERVTAAILKHHWPWNQAFAGKPVQTGTTFPVIELEGGLKLTLLSPDREKLEALIPQWEKECDKAGLIPGVAAKAEPPEGFEAFGAFNIEEFAEEKFEPDHTAPNGTSIVLIAEYEGKRALLAADAHPDLLAASLQKLPAPASFDAVKVPHHGSAHNTSKELAQLMASPLLLISTNGWTHHHPSPLAISRLIRYGGEEKELVFNYRTEDTEVWDIPKWKKKHGYQTRYPAAGSDGTAVVKL